ncbi:MAG: class I SAM-dependent methyltransferase [Planctomycetes bacterium]|nr:class I SAM-dependent methyltransferase [Planctomycetota bacterium]
MSQKTTTKSRTAIAATVKARTIHKKDSWSIEQYMTIFHVPEAKKKEQREWFQKLTEHIRPDEIRVLCPGVGAGRNEIDLIEALATVAKDRKIVCDFIDYSSISCESLRKRLLSPELNYLNEDGTNIFKKNNIQIHVIETDYEDWLDRESPPGPDVAPRYHVILAFFIINFLSNWVQSLKNTIRLLVPTGILVVSQDVGDLCFIDNTFDDIPPETQQGRHAFFRLWRDYYDLRRKLGFDWNSLISPSNMGMIRDIFNDVHRVGIDNEVKRVLRERLAAVTLKTQGGGSLQPCGINWTLQDVLTEEPANFLKSIDYWLSLIRGIGANNENKLAENEVFNCLSIPTPIKEALVAELEKGFVDQRIEFDDLNLGQAFFFLYKPDHERCEEIINKIIELRLDSTETVARYRFMNRSEKFDNVDSMANERLERAASKVGITKTIRAELLNRARDTFNTYVWDKHSAIVSLLSREYLPTSSGKEPYTWRRDDSPILFDASLSSSEKLSLLKSYSLYFALSDRIEIKLQASGRKTSAKITGMIYDDLPRKISFVASVNEQAGDVESYLYHTGELRAIHIKMNRAAFYDNAGIREIVENIYSRVPNVYKDQRGGEIDIRQLSENREYYFTKEVNMIAEEIKKMGDELDNLLRLIVSISRTEAMDNKIVETICLPIGFNDPSTMAEIKDVLSHRYALLTVGYPIYRWNTLTYTSTNSYSYKESGSQVEVEKGYYGLIVYDCLNSNKGLLSVEKNLDRLLGSTFFYSGMDGIYETRREVEASEWQNVAINTQHNMKTILGKAKRDLQNLKDSNVIESNKLLDSAFDIVSNTVERAERLVLFYKRKRESSDIKRMESVRLASLIEGELEIALNYALIDPKLEQRIDKRPFIKILESEGYKAWIEILGSEDTISIDESFRLAMSELLINGLEATDSSWGLRISIDYRESDSIQIIMENTRTMNEKVRAYINEYPNAKIGRAPISLGLTTILQVLYFVGSSYKVDIRSDGHTMNIIDIRRKESA